MFSVTERRKSDHFAGNELFFLSDGVAFSHSIEDARWFSTRVEAKVAIQNLPLQYKKSGKFRIMTISNIIDDEIRVRIYNLKNLQKERERLRKMSKKQIKNLIQSAIRDGADIFKRMNKTVPPLNTERW